MPRYTGGPPAIRTNNSKRGLNSNYVEPVSSYFSGMATLVEMASVGNAVKAIQTLGRRAGYVGYGFTAVSYGNSWANNELTLSKHLDMGVSTTIIAGAVGVGIGIITAPAWVTGIAIAGGAYGMYRIVGGTAADQWIDSF